MTRKFMLLPFAFFVFSLLGLLRGRAELRNPIRDLHVNRKSNKGYRPEGSLFEFSGMVGPSIVAPYFFHPLRHREFADCHAVDHGQKINVGKSLPDSWLASTTA